MTTSVQKTNLADAFWFQEGPGVRNTQFRDSGVKLLNVANITKIGQIDLEKTDRHLEIDEAYGKYGHFLVDAGDLVIASSGISIDQDGFLRTRGAFVEEAHLPLCMNTSTIRFKAVEGKSDLSYLKHWLQSLDFRVQITRLVTGSAQKNFGPTHLKALSINLPHLNEQRRIAAILDQADELCRKRQRAIDRLNQLGQAIFYEMFGDTSALPRTHSFDDIATIQQSLVDPKLPQYRSALHVGPEHIASGVGAISWHNVRTAEEDNIISGKNQFREGDIIYSKIRPYLNKVAIADRQGICSADMYVIQPLPMKSNAHFLRMILMGSDFLSYAETCSNRANIPKLNRKQVESYRFHCPPFDAQQEYAERLSKLELVAGHSSLAAEMTSDLFKSLQHRAFQGDL